MILIYHSTIVPKAKSSGHAGCLVSTEGVYRVPLTGLELRYGLH